MKVFSAHITYSIKSKSRKICTFIYNVSRLMVMLHVCIVLHFTAVQSEGVIDNIPP